MAAPLILRLPAATRDGTKTCLLAALAAMLLIGEIQFEHGPLFLYWPSDCTGLLALDRPLTIQCLRDDIAKLRQVAFVRSPQCRRVRT